MSVILFHNVDHPEKVYNMLQDAVDVAERGVNEEADIEVNA